MLDPVMREALIALAIGNFLEEGDPDALMKYGSGEPVVICGKEFTTDEVREFKAVVSVICTDVMKMAKEIREAGEYAVEHDPLYPLHIAMQQDAHKEHISKSIANDLRQIHLHSTG